MRRSAYRIGIPTAILLCVSLLCAEEPAAERLFLWKVTSASGGESYLLGSIHWLKKESYPLPREIEVAFTRSKYLVVETNESKQDEAKVQQTVLEKGMYSGGDTLLQNLSKPVRDALNALAAKGDVQLAEIEKMKPWFAAIFLSIKTMEKKGYSSEYGIDDHFVKLASTGGKRILELENSDFQIGLLSGLSHEMQEQFLLATLADIEMGLFEKVVAAWNKGDAAGMSRLYAGILSKYPDVKPFIEKLIDERNASMTAAVEGYLKSNDVHFVVAGAAHMVGEKGIIKILQDKKYKVEQISRVAQPNGPGAEGTRSPP